MKRFIFIFSVALLFVSCGQSPEDKANALIKAELRKTLFKPDTYKPIETKLDSAFAPFDDPNLYKIMGDLAKMAAELEGLDYQIKDAKSSMSLWSGPYMSAYGRNEYNEAKNDLNEAQSKYDKLKEKGQAKYQELADILAQKPKFIGYKASHNYRADNNEGNTLIGNDVFIMDPEFKEVLYRCDLEEYNQIQEAIKQLQEQIQENQ